MIRCHVCTEYFISTANEWESAMIWLKNQMRTNSQWSPALNLSNENTNSRSFQRTRSVQDTLEQIQHLFQQKSIDKENWSDTKRILSPSRTSRECTILHSDL
jgi:hypothetical protein